MKHQKSSDYFRISIHGIELVLLSLSDLNSYREQMLYKYNCTVSSGGNTFNGVPSEASGFLGVIDATQVSFV